METLLHGGMNEFLAAIYRHQHQQQTSMAYMSAAYIENVKELYKQQQKEEKMKGMTSELQSLVQKLCRVCGTSIGQYQSAAKFELQDALLNCMKIDIRSDQSGLPARVCHSCTEQLTSAMFQFTQLGTWPSLNHVAKFNWGSKKSDEETHTCTLAQTLPSLCTISAKHGFLLVPEHTDERRVRFVRLIELSANDVSASYILHIYIDLTWDLSIHGQTVLASALLKTLLPRKVTRENAEKLFTSILKLTLCPGITGLDRICRIMSQNGPAVFHDHQNQKLAMEDRFSKTVRHSDCDIVSLDCKQCEACTKYEPVAKQFQEQCLSLSKIQAGTKSTSLSPSRTTQIAEKKDEKHKRDSEKESDTELIEEIEEPSSKRLCMEKQEDNSECVETETEPLKTPPIQMESQLNSGLVESKYHKMNPLGSHPASGLSLLAESASRLPLTADRPNMREQLLAKAVEKKQACGRCERCLRLDDCGNCDYCLDKPKFGGPNTKRRKCRQRTCIYYRQSQNGSRKRQNNHNNYRMESSSLMANLSPSFITSSFASRVKVENKDLKKSEAKSSISASVAHQLSSSLSSHVEKSSTHGTSPSSIETQNSSRRRPALQCHKCKHCAAPDCAKCRFCLDKPKFGGPGRLKQKCIERRCILERHQDMELRKEKERKSQNALLAKETLREFQAANHQLASQIANLKDDFPKPLLNHMSNALKQQQQQLQQKQDQIQQLNELQKQVEKENNCSDNMQPVAIQAAEDEDIEVDVDDS